jgi:hypothetical protein
MILCSFTVFCFLVGVGTWLVGSPSPTWMPSRAIWIGCLLFVGLAAGPVWYRLGFGPDRDGESS